MPQYHRQLVLISVDEIPKVVVAKQLSYTNQYYRNDTQKAHLYMSQDSQLLLWMKF